MIYSLEMNGYDLRRALNTIFDLLRELRQRTDRIYLTDYGTTIAGDLIVRGDISSLVLQLYDELKKASSVISVSNGRLLLDGKDITGTVELNDDDVLQAGVKEKLPPTTGAVLRTLAARTADSLTDEGFVTTALLNSIISTKIDSSTIDSTLPTVGAVKSLISTIVLDGDFANIRTMKVSAVEGESDKFSDAQGNVYTVDSTSWTASVVIYPNASTTDDHTRDDTTPGELKVLFGNNVYIPEIIVSNTDNTQRWRVTSCSSLAISSSLTYRLDWVETINAVAVVNNCSSASLIAPSVKSIASFSVATGISLSEVRLPSLESLCSLKTLSGVISELIISCAALLTDLGNNNLEIVDLYFIPSERGTVPKINSELTIEIDQARSPTITSIHMPFVVNSTVRNGDYYLKQYMEFFRAYISKNCPACNEVDLF